MERNLRLLQQEQMNCLKIKYDQFAVEKEELEKEIENFKAQ